MIAELLAIQIQQPMTMARGSMIPADSTVMGASMGALPPPMAAAKMRAPSGIARAMKFLGGASRPPPVEKATPAQIERVRKSLEAFVEAFKSRKLETLEKARMDLMKALADALVIATAVPLLQAFLRSAAVEIVAALKAGAAPPFDKHAAALQAALDEARAPLGATMVKAGSFWEASI